MHEYEDLEAARLGLLGESVDIVASLSIQYVVVGGWAPYLRNSSPIAHPGTYDVDVLFLKGRTPGYLADVVKAFICGGYLPSAKHRFQLLRELRVGATSLVFNVDLLHPSESEHPSVEFVDHLVWQRYLLLARLPRLRRLRYDASLRS